MAHPTDYGFYSMPENSFRLALPSFKLGDTVKDSRVVDLRIEGTALLISKESLEAYTGRLLTLKDGMARDIAGTLYINAYHIPLMSLADGTDADHQCLFEAATHLEIIRRQMLDARNPTPKPAPLRTLERSETQIDL